VGVFVPWFDDPDRRDEILSRRRRILRPDGPPEEFGYRLARKLNYRFKVPGDFAPYLAAYHRSNWFKVCDHFDGVRRRNTTVQITLDGRLIGMLAFREFRFAECLSNTDFLIAMDASSDMEMRVADVLCAHWQVDDDLASYGDLLEFELAWTEPRNGHGDVWVRVARAMLDRLERDASILFCLAFPLEYSGRCGPGVPADIGRARRQKAMIRHYRKLFGLEPLPGNYGRDGWLWRPTDETEGVIKPPRKRRKPR
jgi:hypothetical protein